MFVYYSYIICTYVAHVCTYICMHVCIASFSFVDVMILHFYSLSPVGNVLSTAPVNLLYKFDIAQEGETFYFAVSR